MVQLMVDELRFQLKPRKRKEFRFYETFSTSRNTISFPGFKSTSRACFAATAIMKMIETHLSIYGV